MEEKEVREDNHGLDDTDEELDEEIIEVPEIEVLPHGKVSGDVLGSLGDVDTGGSVEDSVEGDLTTSASIPDPEPLEDQPHEDPPCAAEIIFPESDIQADNRAEVAKRPSLKETEGLPVVLLGHETPAIQEKVQAFYGSVAAMFEAWLARRKSENTRRAYRRDVMDFVEFLGIPWKPSASSSSSTAADYTKATAGHSSHRRTSEAGAIEDGSWRLLQVTVPTVQAWRDYLYDERNLAPNTLNRRVSSLSGFYRFMREAAAEMRLPITVPNPAHSQFIGREVQEAVTPTEALSPTRARQLISLPEGEGVVASRDRAILKFYLYSGCRIGTGCRLNVEDFVDDDEDPKLRIQEKGKGKSKRSLGINVIAADALREYIERAGLVSGPLFRPRQRSKGGEAPLASRRMDTSTMYRLVQSYLVRIPKAMREHEMPDGTVQTRCMYSPHALRATTATVLLDAGEDIRDVQKLLGHKHVTVTQVYDKRRRGTKDSASHRLSL